MWYIQTIKPLVKRACIQRCANQLTILFVLVHFSIAKNPSDPCRVVVKKSGIFQWSRTATYNKCHWLTMTFVWLVPKSLLTVDSEVDPYLFVSMRENLIPTANRCTRGILLFLKTGQPTKRRGDRVWLILTWNGRSSSHRILKTDELVLPSAKMTTSRTSRCAALYSHNRRYFLRIVRIYIQ